MSSQVLDELMGGLPGVLAPGPRARLAALTGQVATAVTGASVEERRGYRALDWVATTWTDALSNPLSKDWVDPERDGSEPIVDAASARRVAATAKDTAGLYRAIDQVNSPAAPSPSQRTAHQVAAEIGRVSYELAVPARVGVRFHIDSGAVVPAERALPGELWDAGQDVIWAALPDALRDDAVWSSLQERVAAAMGSTDTGVARAAAFAAVEAWDLFWERGASVTATHQAAHDAARQEAAPAVFDGAVIGRRMIDPLVPPRGLPPRGLLAGLRRRTAPADLRHSAVRSATRQAVGACYTPVVAQLQDSIVGLVRELAALS